MLINFDSTRIAGDLIRQSLSTSLAAYNAAETQTLVPITSAEYDSLLSLLGGSKTGASDATLAIAVNSLLGRYCYRDLTYGTGGGSNLALGYPVAFKLKTPLTATGRTDLQFGYGVTSTGSGVALCTKTTMTFTPVSNIICFIIKSPSVQSPAGSFLTTWVESNGVVSGVVGTQTYSASTGNVILPTTIAQNACLQIQCLQSPSILWL